MYYVLIAIAAAIVFGSQASHEVAIMRAKDLGKITAVQFLITVNATYDGEGPGCLRTIRSPWLVPGKKRNTSVSIDVGGCDHGPLTFEVNPSTKEDGSKMTVDLTFYSSVILDASPPTCSIPFNGTYLVPKPGKYDMSLLPNCFTMESREGYHMTYYWFKVFDWRWADHEKTFY